MDSFKFFLEKYRKELFLGGSFLLLIFLGFFLFTFWREEDTFVEVDSSLEENLEKEEVKKEEDSTNSLVEVDIKGEVVHPGVYQVDCMKRVQDVIDLAGGLTDQASTEVNNLSKKVFDEMVIIIYSKEEVSDFKKTVEEKQEVLKSIQEKGNFENHDSLVEEKDFQQDQNVEESLKEEAPSSKKISINQATLEELMSLSGIGESKAQAIIDYRNTNGPFTKLEDLMLVRGIGEAIFEKIKDSIEL